MNQVKTFQDVDLKNARQNIKEYKQILTLIHNILKSKFRETLEFLTTIRMPLSLDIEKTLQDFEYITNIMFYNYCKLLDRQFQKIMYMKNKNKNKNDTVEEDFLNSNLNENNTDSYSSEYHIFRINLGQTYAFEIKDLKYRDPESYQFFSRCGKPIEYCLNEEYYQKICNRIITILQNITTYTKYESEFVNNNNKNFNLFNLFRALIIVLRERVKNETWPEYITGPISASEHYSKEYDKWIYVFGESHDIQKDPCNGKSRIYSKIMPIQKFVKMWIESHYQTYSIPMDIFLEVPKKYASVVQHDWKVEQKWIAKRDDLSNINLEHIRIDDLDEWSTLFNPYLQIAKTKDPYQLQNKARFHYTDVRDLYRKHSKQPAYFDIVNICSLIIWKMEEDILKILKYIPIILSKSADEWVKEYIFALKHPEVGILKQVNKIKDKKLQDYFVDKLYLTRLDEFKKIISFLQDKCKIIQEQSNTNTSNLIPEHILDELHRTCRPLHNNLMDVYLMARIMKNSEFKHIVIYVGNWHANVYRQWLHELGFQERKNINSGESKCIRINEFYPLFNQN
jgi:hypothetical protein